MDPDTSRSPAVTPRARPLLIYDGDCGFCTRTAEHWRSRAAGRLDIAPAQESEPAAIEHGIEPVALLESVHLVDPDGTVLRGAEAVFAVRALAPGGGGALWAYRRVPLVRPITELGYRMVAENRIAVSRVTRWLSGRTSVPPSWVRTRWLFLKLVALSFLAAFASLDAQIAGLIGSEGVLPAADLLERADEVFGDDAPTKMPTILHVDSSDGVLFALPRAGLVAAGALLVGLAPPLALLACFVLYLSLVSVGGAFLTYQWDVLLLELAAVGMLFAPWRWLPGIGGEAPPSRIGVFAARFLLFKLMFLSGWVKLASQDGVWRDLTALEYHYWTQPLPAWTSWYVHHLPSWVHKASTVVMFAIELALPWLVFGPRRLRELAGAGFVLLMALIAVTGNYGFFNLATLALCAFCFDDRSLGWLPRRLTGGLSARRFEALGRTRSLLRVVCLWPAGLLLILLSANAMAARLDREWSEPNWLEALAGRMRPFAIANAYGLFANMTEGRDEILIEGSDDGETWQAFAFRWKPGDVERRPAFCQPHMPRLDWQMWFASLRGWRAEPSYLPLMQKLLEGSPPVRALFADPPFEEGPPRYLRSRRAAYRFSTPDERDATGAWWVAEPRSDYAPPLTLVDGGLAIAEGLNR